MIWIMDPRGAADEPAIPLKPGLRFSSLPISFTAAPLSPDRIDEAYPLARLAVEGLQLSEWRRYAMAVAPLGGEGPHRTEILSLEDARRYFHGLCVYAVRPHLRHARCLVVEHFIALDLVRGGRAAPALMRATLAGARRQGCDGVQIHLPPPPGGAQALAALAALEGEIRWLEDRPLIRRTGHLQRTPALGAPG